MTVTAIAQYTAQGRGQQASGWATYFLYRPTMHGNEHVPTAVAPCTFDAVEDMFPTSAWLCGLRGSAWRRSTNLGAKRPVFEPGADRILFVRGSNGERALAAEFPTGHDGLLSASAAWAALQADHAAIRESWQHLDAAAACTECATKGTEAHA